MGFKNKYSFDDRVLESIRIINKYPHRLPIICERSKYSTDCPHIDKNKYLVPDDFAFGQFIFVIRKRLKLPPEKALFLFINNNVPQNTQSLNDIYNANKDEDGFLYVSYSYENTFG
jgi:GABA(A) receptor-associated protein